jgi:hypothetical protein
MLPCHGLCVAGRGTILRSATRLFEAGVLFDFRGRGSEGGLGFLDGADADRGLLSLLMVVLASGVFNRACLSCISDLGMRAIRLASPPLSVAEATPADTVFRPFSRAVAFLSASLSIIL